MAMETEAGNEAKPILEKANSMRGVRYHWGEASRSGTDCSGFTSQVFKSQGVRLPRTSREQASVGQRVSHNDLKPGDLVFFHTTRGHRVSHVGIYVGHGKFIHASSGGGKVQVNSLADGYYAHRLVTARRVKTKAAHKAAEPSHELATPKDTDATVAK
jgi:cell wall-associated NlpC family hydrolase